MQLHHSTLRTSSLISCTFSGKKVGGDEGCEGVVLREFARRVSDIHSVSGRAVWRAQSCWRKWPKNCCGKPNDMEGQGMKIWFRESRDDGNRFSGYGRARTTPKTGRHWMWKRSRKNEGCHLSRCEENLRERAREGDFLRWRPMNYDVSAPQKQTPKSSSPSLVHIGGADVR